MFKRGGEEIEIMDRGAPVGRIAHVSPSCALIRTREGSMACKLSSEVFMTVDEPEVHFEILGWSG
jgi:antitoxin (DNA-binding transcriptional repressor) of toxin-antitoxin stability system